MSIYYFTLLPKIYPLTSINVIPFSIATMQFLLHHRFCFCKSNFHELNIIIEFLFDWICSPYKHGNKYHISRVNNKHFQMGVCIQLQPNCVITTIYLNRDLEEIFKNILQNMMLIYSEQNLVYYKMIYLQIFMRLVASAMKSSRNCSNSS